MMEPMQNPIYLIYDTEENANARADEEGKQMRFSYWTDGRGTRWLTAPQATADGQWALEVTDYTLDDSERSTTVDSYTPLEIEEEENLDI